MKFGKKAISPMIGLILLVAITVILASVLGMFAFSAGSGVKTSPKAQFILKDADDKINDDKHRRNNDGDPTNDRWAIDAIAAITHVGGDPIKCKDIQIIVKDKTNGWSWVLEYDSTNYTEEVEHTIPGSHNVNYKFHAFYDPNKNGWTPIIYVFSSNPRDPGRTDGTSLTSLGGRIGVKTDQLGGPEYSVKNDGILQTGDTVILMEGNVTVWGLSGYEDYTGPGATYTFLTEWLADTYWNSLGNDQGLWFKNIWNSTDVPAEIEITIVHIPTKSIIYQGSVTVQ